MIIFLRYLTVVLTIGALLSFYFLLLITVPVTQIIQENITQKSVVKEVIAYSLRKQIEIESEQVICENGFNKPRSFLKTDKKLWTKVSDTDFFVFNVYYDDRLEPFRYIRLLGMIRGYWNESLYCQVQLKSNDFHITKAVRSNIWLKEWDLGNENTYNPVLISCNIPDDLTPKLIFISTKPCQLGETNFRIIYPREHKIILNRNKQPKKYLTTVCVKPINFDEDISNRLVQWIEINKILGADKFEFFVKRVPKNMQQILHFYSKKHKSLFFVKKYKSIEEYVKHSLDNKQLKLLKGSNYLINQLNNLQEVDLSLKKFNYSFVIIKHKMQSDNHVIARAMDVGKASDAFANANNNNNNNEEFKENLWQKRRNEVIAYNDCLYRNLHSSHFVIPVDIDEIIVPKRFYTWEEALDYLFTSAPNLQKEFASFSARNAYFLEDFLDTPNEETSFFFKFNKRSEFSEEGESGKSFVSTKNALTVFNHYALESLKPGIRRTYFMSRDLVQMNHYKKTCLINLLPQCAKYLFSSIRTIDNVISKYKSEFYENYKKVVSELSFYFKRFKFLQDYR